MKHEVCGFEHLHLHSHYSTLDGVGSHIEYCERAKKNNQSFLCVSDHGSLAGIPAQLRACDKFGINPIFAIETYLQRGHKLDFNDLPADEKKKLRKSYHLLLIADSETGYKNLVTLASYAELHGFYYKPRINWEMLKEYSEGLFCGSCCVMGESGQAFIQHGEDVAEAIILEYYNLFKDKYFLEIMFIDFAPQRAYNQFLIKMHLKYNIPLIITNDVHYCDAKDSETQTNLLLVQTQRTRAELDVLIASGNTDLFEVQDKNLYMKSEEDLNLKWEQSFKDIVPYELFKEAKCNTVRVCNNSKGVKIDRSIKLPEIENADEKLKDEIKKGLLVRKLPNTNEYKNRIAEEYDLIVRKGFSSYFLIQKQVIDEARRYCIDVLKTSPTNAINPGRGSAASSLVLYLLGITDVDPIRHGLLFSRFLSEARGRTINYKFKNDVLESFAFNADINT